MTDQPLLFLLTEYDVALKRFIQETINVLMREKDPVLKMIPTERRQHITTTQNTMPSGQVVQGSPLRTEMTFEVRDSDVLNGDVDGFLASIDAAADDGVASLMPQIFSRLAALADAAGTASNAGGQPISHELVLSQFEKMDILFDESGNPELPTMICSPQMFEAYKRLGPPSAEIEERFQKMLARKREEFNASRRTRKLP